MPDPTPERVGELDIIDRMKCHGAIESLAAHEAFEYHARLFQRAMESHERQRAEIEALTALVRELAREGLNTARAYRCHLDSPPIGVQRERHGDELERVIALFGRARLAATGESDD